MVNGLPKLDLSQLGVENGYSKLVITMEIGKNPTSFPGPMTPQPTNPPDRVSVKIESNTNSPMASPEKAKTIQATYEFPLEEGQTAQDVASSINESLILGHLTQA